MAHTITFTSSVVDLTITPTSGTLALHDYLTGSVSGVHGIVLWVTDSTHITVAELDGTFDDVAPTDTLRAPSGATATITAASRVSPSALIGTSVNANCVLVEGSDATVTKIFGAIADDINTNHSGTGVTNPTVLDPWLKLDMVIYIGSTNQASATVALSQEETVDLTGDGLACVRIIGKSGATSTLTMGIVKYLDDSSANWPILNAYKGSTLKILGGDEENYAIETNSYSELNIWHNFLHHLLDIVTGKQVFVS